MIYNIIIIKFCVFLTFENFALEPKVALKDEFGHHCVFQRKKSLGPIIKTF